MREDEFRSTYESHGGMVHCRSLSHVDRAVCEGEDAGFFKLMYTKDKKIKGCVVVCQRAGEIINELSVAMQNGKRGHKETG